MKCLHCSASFASDEKLLEHYFEYHKLDINKKIFQKLFEPSKNGSIFRKFPRCDDFLSTENCKVRHNFLKHYVDGQSISFEDKPLEIVKTGFITKYKISVNKHGDCYDFADAQQVVDDFLRNVRSKFKVQRDVLVKCGFLIENIQPSQHENMVPILSRR